jgi:hypothetical protein
MLLSTSRVEGSKIQSGFGYLNFKEKGVVREKWKIFENKENINY